MTLKHTVFTPHYFFATTFPEDRSPTVCIMSERIQSAEDIARTASYHPDNIYFVSDAVVEAEFPKPSPRWKISGSILLRVHNKSWDDAEGFYVTRREAEDLLLALTEHLGLVKA